MTPIPRFYLIDGSSYLYRAFFALPPLTSPSGLPTNAVYGVTTMLLKLLGDQQPEYLGIVFDAPGGTFRDEMFAAYKAHRPDTPPDLVAQFEHVQDVIAALSIPTLMVPGVEADDVIATLVTRATAAGAECVVVTGDKDLMQLVGPHVRLWDTMHGRWTDEAGVRERWGVAPGQVVDILALMGDAVDNIPGVKGIGEKTAVALIREFGSLEHVLSRLPEVERMALRGAKKVAALLRDGAETARLSRALAVLRCDVPLDHSLEDFRRRPPDHAALRALFVHLGFQSLARQVSAAAPAATVAAETIEEPAALGERLAALRAGGRPALFACGPDGPASTTPASDVLVCGDGPPVRIPLARDAVRTVVAKALGDPTLECVVHDWKRTILRLEAAGVAIAAHAFDIMIASYLVDASAAHTLRELAADRLGAALAEGDAPAAASVLRPLAAQIEPRLREMGLERLFDTVEMPLARVLAGMERRGILLDTVRLGAMSHEFNARLDALMKEIHALAGGPFNINSPPQLREILFDRLGLATKGVRRGKTGYSTDADVLTRLSASHPLPAKILEYRALAKLQSTYIDALPAAVNPATGRLHTSFNQTVAATGRLSSSDPNLQNIPIRGEEGRRIREAFVSAPGHVFVAADYSQIELRVLAHLSGDPALLDAFRTNQDIHARTAAEVFNVLPGTITGDMRRAAKVINFGIVYGMGPQRLAQELGISLPEAQRYIASYFERYAGVRIYMQAVVAEARERGYVATILGRRRAVPELRSTDRGAAQAAERAAANTPIQGSAADLIKLAMVAVDRRLARDGLRAAILLQVHDELLLEADERDETAVRAAVQEEMENVMTLAVPLRVDIGVGRSWAEAH